MGTLSLPHALALARTHHPRLRGSAWRVRAAGARLTDADRRPAPTVSLELENLGGVAGSDRYEATAQLGQRIERGGDRRARAQAAASAEQVAWADLSLAEREALTEAADRFLDAWSLQERGRHFAAAESLAERTVAAAAERFRAGAGPASEQSRAEALLGLRRAERVRNAAELEIGRRRLAASWGSADASFEGLVLDPPGANAPTDPGPLIALLDTHPERRRALAASALHEARVREARAERTPDLELTGGVRHLASEPGQTFVVGVSMPLAFGSRGRGAVAAADAEQQAARAEADAGELELRSALLDALARYEAARASHAIVAREVVPRSAAVVDQLTAGYRSGRSSSLEYLEGQRSLLEAELQQVDATAAAWRARLALERLLGRSLDTLEGEGSR